MCVFVYINIHIYIYVCVCIDISLKISLKYLKVLALYLSKLGHFFFFNFSNSLLYESKDFFL